MSDKEEILEEQDHPQQMMTRVMTEDADQPDEIMMVDLVAMAMEDRQMMAAKALKMESCDSIPTEGGPL